MRTAILSDIHSNLEALEAALGALTFLRVDRVVCLGDLVGYGADPQAVVSRIREVVQFTIMGNHDAAVAGKMDFLYYYDSAKEALVWTREQLSADNLAFLQALPYSREEGRACYVHGEPLEPETFNYLYLFEHAEFMRYHYAQLKDVTFVGHSHLRRVYELSADDVIELPVEDLVLRPDRKYAIAVGSVGQPRDYDPRAAFAVYDDESHAVTFHRAEYSVDAAAEKILRAGLPDYFAARLFSGA